jgi:hypothetical protein
LSFLVKRLKYHPYFLNSVAVRRPYLTEDKIENAIIHHEVKLKQENGRTAFHGYDMEAKKYLKVIVENEGDDQVVFNAYFDRSYKK